MADALKMTPQVPVWLADLLADLNGSSATGGFRCFDANIELKFGVSSVKGLSKVTSFLRGMARPLNAEFRAHQVWEGNSQVIVLGDAVLSVKKRPDVVIIPPFAYFFQMSKGDKSKVQRLTIVAGPVTDMKGVAEWEHCEIAVDACTDVPLKISADLKRAVAVLGGTAIICRTRYRTIAKPQHY